ITSAVSGFHQASRSVNQPNSASASVSQHRGVLDQYCVTCHNDRQRTAGLILDKMDLTKVSENAEVWEKVVRKLRSESMPPPGMPRPDKGTYHSLASWVETELDKAAKARPNVGRPILHRLNRTEYANAIRDLLALEIDVASLLPPDDSSYGF